MFTWTLLSCFISMLMVAWFGVAGWWVWPRLRHARQLQDPLMVAELTHQAEERNLMLMRQRITLEAEAARVERIRAETEQLRAVVKLKQGESAFTVEGTFYHAPKEPILLDQPTTTEPPPELWPLLAKCDNILIVARRGAGKSNLIRRIIDARQDVIVLDPHASPQQWAAHTVIGAGLNHEAIAHYLHTTIEEDRRERYHQLSYNITTFAPKTIAIDEMTEVTSEVDVATPIQRLLNCRKVNMQVVMGGHSMNAKDLGLDGRFNLLKNFDAVIKIDYNQATDERQYWLCLQPQTHHDTFIEVQNPGLYVPPVPAVPTNVIAVPTVPDPVPDLSGYTGRDLEIAQAILKGWTKSKTRSHVTGRSAVIGKRYDEIKAEMNHGIGSRENGVDGRR